MADTENAPKTGALANFMGGGALSVGKNEMAAALLDSASEGTTGGGDKEYLSFSGQGANFAGWKLGRDKASPDPDAMYIVDPTSASEGWTCWKGGSVAAKSEWSVYKRSTQAIPEAELEDHGPYADGDGWSFMMGISMFDVDAPGKQISFSTTSKSGRNALGDVTKEIAQRLVEDEPHVPVIQLASEKFTAQGKVNGKPILAIEGWVTNDEVMAYLALGDDGDLDDLLAGKYAGAQAEAEEVPEEAPTKRRRRAAG